MEQYAHHIASLTTSPESGKQLALDKLLKRTNKEIWDRLNSNEWGRLLPNEVGKSIPENERIKVTGTIKFINKSQVPKGRKVTYANYFCAICPKKAENHRV